jgi:hypothetical protein
MSVWVDIKPGDIGFTKGGGLIGWVIRHGTGSPYAHSFVYHKPLGKGYWETVEAWPALRSDRDGVRVRIRTEAPDKVIRIAGTPEEVNALLSASSALVGVRYGWGEIVRIALRFLGIKVKGWESSSRAICSNHCTQAVLASRPALAPLFQYAPSHTWPGELAAALDRICWIQDRVLDRKLSEGTK